MVSFNFFLIFLFFIWITNCNFRAVFYGPNNFISLFHVYNEQYAEINRFSVFFFLFHYNLMEKKERKKIRWKSSLPYSIWISKIQIFIKNDYFPTVYYLFRGQDKPNYGNRRIYIVCWKWWFSKKKNYTPKFSLLTFSLFFQHLYLWNLWQMGYCLFLIALSEKEKNK